MFRRNGLHTYFIVYLHADAQATLRAATPKPTPAPVVPMSPEERAEFERTVPEQYHDYADVFSEAAAASLPPHRPYDHTIDLEEGAMPPYGPIYSMSETELKALWEHLDDTLGKGFIRPSNSPDTLCQEERRLPTTLRRL